MTPSPPALPIYLQGGSDAVFATFHPAAPGGAHDTAVVLCPPFGWDEVCAYRSLREWARRLAAEGYPALRISFPSTGDSGAAPRDPDRLEAWRKAVEHGSRWLLSASGARRLAAVGMGLGGLIAYLAASAGAPIDDLVLWGTPARGRSLVRQLRAFSRLEVSRFFEGLEPPPPLPPGELEAGGFLLSAQTVGELEALDLAVLDVPDAAMRRVLLLERDGLVVDERLREALQRPGAAVTVAPGGGYGAMTSHPQQAQPALAVFEQVAGWLREASTPSPGTVAPPVPVVGASPSAEIRLASDAVVRETPVTIEQPFGVLAGVLVEPCDPPSHGLCAVLLNAGAVRRIGPSRMWVETARRWAQRGVPTLRLDVEGLGDSDGDETPYSDDGALYVPTLIPQVIAAIDFLHARGVGERFALGGLCAGAYWAFHATLRDPRVCAAMMMNPRALIWDTGLGPARDLRALLSQKPSLERIRRVATRARVLALARWLLATPRRRLDRMRDPQARALATGSDVDAALHQLIRSGKRAMLLFSEHEPLYDELLRTGRLAMLERSPNVTLEHVLVRDHTMRPAWTQAQAQAALDRALDRELQAQGLIQNAVSENPSLVQIMRHPPTAA